MEISLFPLVEGKTQKRGFQLEERTSTKLSGGGIMKNSRAKRRPVWLQGEEWQGVGVG